MIKKSPIKRLFSALRDARLIAEAAKQLGVSRNTLYYYCKCDKFPKSDVIGTTKYAKILVSFLNSRNAKIFPSGGKLAFPLFSIDEILAYTRARWEEDQIKRQIKINIERKK